MSLSADRVAPAFAATGGRWPAQPRVRFPGLRFVERGDDMVPEAYTMPRGVHEAAASLPHGLAAPDHLAHFIDEGVDRLDLSAIFRAL